VCARGLDVGGDVNLAIPDLRVLAGEDLAVAWGLNRVRAGEDVERWSRGTRVFERRAGAWVMVHQHLSIPYDLETGEARTDLSP
jgi:ketosteroid isomerase-like protein